VIKVKNKIISGSVITLLAFYFSACHPHKKNVQNKSDNTSSSSYTELMAGILKMNVKEIKTEKLYRFVSDWYGTPYKYGGCDKKGTDCSCLALNLYSVVYEKKIARTAGDIKGMCEKVNPSSLKEGDFIFFKIKGNDINHVGVFLKNNKFVHATTSKGVMINDVNEEYYKKYFYCFGRLK
jgi:lipoprotein Spr